MFSLIRGGKPETSPSKVAARAGALHTHAVAAWADTYLNETGRALLMYSREGDSGFLDEAEESAAALLAMVQELKRRG